MSELFFHRSAARKALGILGAMVLLALPAAAAAQSADELTEDARQFVQYGEPVIAITGVQVVEQGLFA